MRGDEPHPLTFGSFCRETQQASAFLGDLRLLSFSQPAELLDQQVRVLSGAVDLPRAGDEPFDEDGTLREDPGAIGVGDHSYAVGVRQEEVVVLGNEASGCRGVFIGEWRAGQIEKLTALFVAEGS